MLKLKNGAKDGIRVEDGIQSPALSHRGRTVTPAFPQSWRPIVWRDEQSHAHPNPLELWSRALHSRAGKGKGGDATTEDATPNSRLVSRRRRPIHSSIHTSPRAPHPCVCSQWTHPHGQLPTASSASNLFIPTAIDFDPPSINHSSINHSSSPPRHSEADSVCHQTSSRSLDDRRHAPVIPSHPPPHPRWPPRSPSW